MKKLVLVLALGLLLGSCGRSGWSCKKRYVKTNVKNLKNTSERITFVKESISSSSEENLCKG